MKKIQRGISLIESLIALVILLFVFFAFSMLLEGIIANNIILNEQSQQAEELFNAVQEYKIAGVKGNNYSVTNNGEEVTFKNNADNVFVSTGTLEFVSQEPVALLNVLTCDSVSLSCAFDALGTATEGGGGKYTYDFGNGDEEELDLPGENALVTYTSSGNYTITLTVTDKYGRTSTDIKTVTI